MKRFFAFLMVLCICSIIPTTTFAAETESILSIDQEKVSTASTREMTYNQVWIDAGKVSYGSFSVKNPHTSIFTTTNGTLAINSNNPNALVHVVVNDGISVIYDGFIGPNDGEVLFSSSSNSYEYAINYYVYSTNKTNGIRINCWLY